MLWRLCGWRRTPSLHIRFTDPVGCGTMEEHPGAALGEQGAELSSGGFVLVNPDKTVSDPL